jgi:hypothetical protein
MTSGLATTPAEIVGCARTTFVTCSTMGPLCTFAERREAAWTFFFKTSVTG